MTGCAVLTVLSQICEMGVGEKDLLSNYDRGHGGGHTGLPEITLKSSV